MTRVRRLGIEDGLERLKGLERLGLEAKVNESSVMVYGDNWIISLKREKIREMAMSDWVFHMTTDDFEFTIDFHKPSKLSVRPT